MFQSKVAGVQAPRCAAGLAPVRSRRPRVLLNGHAESVSCSVNTGTSTVCSAFRSETGSCGLILITSAICSNTICGTGIPMIFGTVLRLCGLCGPLDCLHHWHLSLRLSSGWTALGVSSLLRHSRQLLPHTTSFSRMN